MIAIGNNAVSKVVIDTNVIVSGLNFRGKPREILDLLRAGGVQLCISPFILEEVRVVLWEDFGWSAERIGEVVEKLKDRAILVEPQIRVSVIKGKDDDNRILECAVAADAQFIISGDKRHLLPLKQYQGIRIVSPDEFLRLSFNRG